MPDFRDSYGAPRDWGEAFAALPMEVPPADAWTSIARRLLQRQPDARRRRRPYWLAMAAAIALAMVIPVFQWIERENPETLPTSSSVATAAVAPTPSSIPTRAKPVESTVVADESQPIAMLPVPESSTSSSFPTTVTAKATAPRIDKSANAREIPPSSPSDSAAKATAMAEQHRQLENLYAESARLEAVLAQLQEPRVASATAATLSAELQDRIADIDGALSQPDVPSTSQVDLWQQRVDALRQLTGVETTQRWMAAQGTATDGPLAQVY